ncbi:MAG TPA: protoporphyrinogen oxidase [Acidobacteria bacterium]|nr:protoporphyrinogen oxidase [Acidobacteriota bacterium]
MPARVVIVGAGVGGLAAAHHLTVQAAARGLPLDVVVLEAADTPGGWLGTERFEGALLERGPDTVVTHKPAGLALCARLGLAGRLVYKPAGRIDVLDGGRLLSLPAGFALAVPTRPRSLLASSLLSWRGKLRALAEPWRAARPLDADESVASYVRRRFGDELYRRMSEPVVGGLFMADTEELSLGASFPRLAGGGRLTRPSGGATAPPPPPVATLDGGLGQIVEALVARLPAGTLQLGRRVEGISRTGEGFLLKTPGGPPFAADAVLLALPAPASAALVADLDPGLSAVLGRIPYASAVTAHLAWPHRAVGRPPRCHGFFVPRTAGSAVVAASFVSVKYPERVPADQLVVRVFLGGALHPEAIGQSDADLVDLAARLLAPLLDVREPPAWSRVWRHPGAMPQRRVGHPALVEHLRARLAEHPGLAFAGGPLGAYGVPDSIAEGEAAAERVLQRVG